ncbi:hypothetical protein MMC26_004563 [Xylographa opegraphella]|nr:hypothetical protein [Xylographa opegraphella]
MSNFGPLSIDMLLRPLGAKNDALNVESPIEPVRRIPFQDDELRAKALSTSGLRNVLKLLTSVSGWMYSESRAHSLCILCRVLVDTCVTKDRSTLEAAEDAFECLVSSIPEIQLEAEVSKIGCIGFAYTQTGQSLIILSSAFSQLKDAQLRLQLLRCIPATTLRLSLLRRRLSLAFFYENSNYLTKQPPDLISIRDIIAQLRKPEYSIGINTDYVQLAANIAILDIGLDDGDPPDFAVDLDPDTIFNGKVDKLAEVVKDILSKIADAGASFMTRTEAKDGLEAFYNRIVYAVRTKPRPKNSHFGTSNISAGDVMSNGGFMSNFLSNRKLAVDIKDVLHNETSSEKASD